MTSSSLVRVFWTNHGYFSSEEFSTLAAAVAYAKAKCFEATFVVAGEVVGAWTIFGGFREFGGRA